MSYHENKYQIYEFKNAHGISPFNSWFSMLDDCTAYRVITNIAKVEVGIFNNCKSLGKGLWEIKIFFGPGIRIYFGKRGYHIILLWGGTKNLQAKDITRANKYWVEYLKTGATITWH